MVHPVLSVIKWCYRDSPSWMSVWMGWNSTWKEPSAANWMPLSREGAEHQGGHGTLAAVYKHFHAVFVHQHPQLHWALPSGISITRRANRSLGLPE